MRFPDRQKQEDKRKMENEMIRSRLSGLRSKMAGLGIDYFLIPTADYHNSEYVAPYFRTREFFSGFTGSNGTLVVGMEEAGLWTDGRYFIQAEKELAGTGVDLYRELEEGVPTVDAWLADRLAKADVGTKTVTRQAETADAQAVKEGHAPTLGFDGRCVNVSQMRKFRKEFAGLGVRFVTDVDPAGGIWQDRPARPASPAFVLKEEFAGESAVSKTARLREKMAEEGAGLYVENRLDSLMWLFNLRGHDVECTPVALSFGVVTMDRRILFLQEEAVTDEVRAYAGETGLELLPYDTIYSFLEDPSLYRTGRSRRDGEANVPDPGRIWFQPGSLSVRLLDAVQKGRDEALRQEKKNAAGEALVCSRQGGPGRDVEKRSPVEDFKAVKNEVELGNIRSCYRDDSAAVCRFLYWLSQHVKKGTVTDLTEMDAAQKMDSLRAQIHDYVDLSFETISAYGPNAAMMHYTAKEGACAQLKPEGMLLVDCGGQYLRGTTDVTRTMALGPVTDDMRRHYTLTAVGNLQLLDAVFLYGCSGRNVDILAREPLWQTFVDYKCGTGHGIGYLLSVHEGPQNIRWRFTEGMAEAVLEPGMIVSDEPGVYIEGQYGIRIETILEVTEAARNGDGRFLRFAPLTLVPLDPALIDPAYLTPRTREVLNRYHARVYEEIASLIPEEERSWLREQTRPL